MWRPKSAGELERAVSEMLVDESSILDFKEQLPDQPRRNVDIAVDVAAMAVAGGVVAYGVKEEDDGSFTAAPIELAGARERVEAVVRSSVAETPFFEVDELRLDDEDGRGYLIVSVPASELAPHQIVARGKLEGRYYGRSGTLNKILSEAEVARLYERRQRWDVDGEALLAEIVGAAPHGETREQAFLHAFVHPVATTRDSRLWQNAAEAAAGRQALQRELQEAARGSRFRTQYDPTMRLSNWTQRGADSWSLGQESDDARKDVRCDVNRDGRIQYFCGRAADTHGDAFWAFPPLIAGEISAVLALAGHLYQRAGYLGPVVAGVAVTGLRGAVGGGVLNQRRYNADGYLRTRRFQAPALDGSGGAARELVGDLVATFEGESFDPFPSPDQ